ncbi:hypothetical protein ACHAXS_012401 [Conticribra weissflogii]
MQILNSTTDGKLEPLYSSQLAVLENLVTPINLENPIDDANAPSRLLDLIGSRTATRLGMKRFLTWLQIELDTGKRILSH